jgi:hypothetical protein
MLVGMMLCEPALGQVVQYQYTPPPPVVPLPFHPFEAPSTLQIPGVVPPDRVVKRSARLPHAAVPTAPETPRYVPHHGRVVIVPPALVPGQDNYSDRAARCAHAGAAAGIGANHLGAFTAQCAN